MISYLAEELNVTAAHVQQGHESLPLDCRVAGIALKCYKPEARLQERLEGADLARA
jgi:hypothetical protein